MMASDRKGFALLVTVEEESRASSLRQRLALILPRASIVAVGTAALAEERLPRADAALIDGGPTARTSVETLRVLRARGFDGPMVVITAAPDDAALRETAIFLGARVDRWREVAHRFPQDQLARAALADNAASLAGAEDDPAALDLAIVTYESLLAEAIRPEQRFALESTIKALRNGGR